MSDIDGKTMERPPAVARYDRVAAAYSYEVSDLSSFSDAQIAEGLALTNLLHAESVPEDEPFPLTREIHNIRSRSPADGAWSVRARSSSGQLVCEFVVATQWEREDDPDVGKVGVRVHPGHRGRGVGAGMLAYQAAFARALGQRRLHGSTMDRFSGSDSFAESLGAVEKSRRHTNELQAESVDAELMRQWMADAAIRSADYELVFVDGRIPDELIEDYIAFLPNLNTAPSDDLEVSDRVFSVEGFRKAEAAQLAQPGVSWMLLARGRATGELVGMHSAGWAESNPKVLYIGWTVVSPAHRGAALGKWLKAEMTLKVITELPQVAVFRTDNADSNAPMLGINAVMGYEPSISQVLWELRHADLEAWLAARGIDVPDVNDAVDRQRPSC